LAGRRGMPCPSNGHGSNNQQWPVWERGNGLRRWPAIRVRRRPFEGRRWENATQRRWPPRPIAAAADDAPWLRCYSVREFLASGVHARLGVPRSLLPDAVMSARRNRARRPPGISANSAACRSRHPGGQPGGDLQHRVGPVVSAGGPTGAVAPVAPARGPIRVR